MSQPRISIDLLPSLIWGLKVVQGLRVVPVFVYRYSMKISLKKARSPGTTGGGQIRLGTIHMLHLEVTNGKYQTPKPYVLTP